ncbi:MAG TPA: tetratricopeptide repeat protein [Terriglobales bacterium]|nr:tetratricopeptide repeat protein [Terriglobales bacterium]
MMTGAARQQPQASQPPSKNGSVPFWERRGALEVILLCVSVVAFISTLSFDFVYDDRVQVLDNPFIQSWRYFFHDFTSHVWAQTHKPAVYYRPVFLSWLRLNYLAFGPHAWGWHFAVVLIHALATVLVFRLALRLLQSRWQAAIAGLFFAIHPIHVENVAWVSGAVDPLMSVFFVGSFLGYLNWRQRGSLPWMVGSLFLAFLAMLTKESGITLPAVVLAYAWIFSAAQQAGRTSVATRLRETATQALPFALVALAYWTLRQEVLQTQPPIHTTYTTILLTLPGLLLFYLRLLVWPVGLCLFYDRQYVQHMSLSGFVLPLSVLALLAALLLLSFRRDAQRKEAAFGFAFALLTLSPALWVRWFPPDDFVHDRYLYLPFAGFALLFAIALVKLRGRSAPGWIGPPRQVLVAFVVAVALLISCGLTQLHWTNDLLLWSHCFKTARHNQRVLNNLASSLGERGEYQRAVPLFLEVLAQDPSSADAQGNLGYTYYRMDQLPQAEKHLSQAIQLDPLDSHSLLYLGFTLYKLGSLERAQSNLSRAIVLDPQAQGAHLALSLVLEQRGDLAGALREAEAELAYHPDEQLVRERLKHLRDAK